MPLNCYIDEAGDEGIASGGSRWFMLGALIVPGASDLKSSSAVPRIKQRLGRPNAWPLHWARLNHHQKLFVCSELLTEQWTFCCVATDKSHASVVGAPGLRTKWYLYFYSTRLLLERLSWFARDAGDIASLVFEHRANMSYGALIQYLALLRAWRPPTKVSWQNVDWEHPRILAKGNSRLLQAADCVCGAVKDALEYSQYGFVEPRYILTLGGRLYRRRGNLFSYGLKVMPSNLTVSHLSNQPGYGWLTQI